MSEFIGADSWRGPRYIYWQWHWNALLLVLEEIEGLILANAPLAEGLLALSHDAPNWKFRELFLVLHEDVAGGFALHEALRRRPQFFPAYCADAVRAGEESGRLAEVLHDLQQDLSGRLSLRRRTEQVGSYLFYVIIMEAWIILGILQFVMPQFIEIFSSFGRGPGFLMRLLDTATDWYVPHLVLLLAIAVPILWLVTQATALQGAPLPRLLQYLGMKIPIARGVLVQRNLAQGSAIAALLVEAGLPLHEAFRAAGNSDLAAPCQRAFTTLAQRIEQGSSLRDALQQQSGEFPKSFCGLVALGENSGQVPEALRQVTVLYQVRALRNAGLSLDIGGPLLVCATGCAVFVVYFAFFQWILALPSLIPTT